MFICGMVLGCAGTFINTWLESGPADLIPTVVHSYKLLIITMLNPFLHSHPCIYVSALM